MARYLVVAHLTAASPELRREVGKLAHADRSAEFTLLVPATPQSYWRTWDETEAATRATLMAEMAREILTHEGVPVARAVTGAREPLLAIEDEIREHGPYDMLVISTLPPGISRWLGLDLVHRAEKRFGLPVIHVVSEAPADVPVPAGRRHEPVAAGRDTSSHEAGMERPGPASTRPAILREDALPEAIPAAEPVALDPEVRRLWERLDGGDDVANLFLALAPNPALLHIFAATVSSLWAHCGLEPELRELVILRTAQNNHSAYLWHEHVLIARSLGIPDARIAALEHWQSAEHVHFDARERAVLRYVDAIARRKGVGPARGLLSGYVDAATLVGVTLLCGFYTMTAMFVDALEVPPEGRFVGWQLY
jgi:alkylhydroperoxidase family enzyme